MLQTGYSAEETGTHCIFERAGCAVLVAAGTPESSTLRTRPVADGAFWIGGLSACSDPKYVWRFFGPCVLIDQVEVLQESGNLWWVHVGYSRSHMIWWGRHMIWWGRPRSITYIDHGSHQPAALRCSMPRPKQIFSHDWTDGSGVLQDANGPFGLKGFAGICC